MRSRDKGMAAVPDRRPTERRHGPDIDVALDAIVGASLRPVSAGLTALFLFYAVSHLVVQPKGMGTRMAAGALVTALILFSLYLTLRQRPVASRWAHPIAAAMMGLLLVANLLFMDGIREPQQTTNLMLLVIGGGCFFLSARWLALFLAATMTGWVIVMSRAPPSAAWMHFGFALVSASALSLIAHTLRVQTFRRLEGLRLQDEARKAELEAALAAAEVSRNDLEKAMEATRQSEERFRQTSEALGTLVAASPLAIFALDRAGHVKRWNIAAERIFGWSQQEVLGQPLPLALEDSEISAAVPAGVLQGKSLTDVETRCRIRSGRWIDISLSAAPLSDAHGAAEGVMAVVADITGRKRAEEGARRLILEQAARAQAEEAQRRQAFLAEASRTLASSLDYEATLERIARLAVSHLADWCVVDLAEEDTSPRRLTVTCADPSRQELAHELERCCPPDPNRSDPLLRVQQTGQSEITAEIPDSLLSAIAPEAEHLRILRQLGFKSSMSVPLLARGRLLGAMILIAAESGRRYGPRDLALAEDLASRAALAVDNARLYQALRTADQRKDEFLAMLAHELRNPLGALSNASQLLKRFGPDEPRLRRALDTIERQVSHQARLLDDLLDVSRITRGKIVLRRARLDLAQLVRDTAEDRRLDMEAAGLTLSLELPGEPVWVDGDPTRLAQVVGNLLQNAEKFTDPGGRVTVRAAVRSRQLGVRSQSEANAAASPDSFAAVTVGDTGIGIEPEMLPRIFETFTQADRSLDRSRGGLGLGLALVKGLVELHGGGVWAESAGLGHGAELSFWLPIAPAPAASANVPAPAAVPAGPIRVLIVEDNRAAAETLRDLLESSGCTVAVAYSGPAALEAARQFRPEVVLCDLGLPGMDGFQVAEALRRDPATAAARLIAVTGYGQEEDRRRSREAGFDLHLVKPIDFDELQRLLEVTPERHQV